MNGYRLVLSCEHGGNQIPPGYRDLFADLDETLASHRGWDIGALPLARLLANHWQVPLVALQISRLLIEVNRSEHHPRLFSTWSKQLPSAERQRLIHDVYRPHRQRVREQLAAAMPPVVHLGIHSFTPILDGHRRTADIGLLYDPQRPAEQAFCRHWQERLQQASGWRIRRNYPYRGTDDGLTTALRSELPAAHYLGLELEVNQALLRQPGEPEALARLLVETLPSSPLGL